VINTSSILSHLLLNILLMGLIGLVTIRGKLLKD